MLAAIGTEDGVDVMGGVRGDGPGGAANGFHDPDVAQVAEGDEFAVGRDVRRAAEANRFLGTRRGQRTEQREGLPGEFEEDATSRESCQTGKEKWRPRTSPIAAGCFAGNDCPGWMGNTHKQGRLSDRKATRYCSSLPSRATNCKREAGVRQTSGILRTDISGTNPFQLLRTRGVSENWPSHTLRAVGETHSRQGGAISR